MKTRISLLASFLLVGFLFSCENLVPEMLSTDITTIVDDEILSLKSDDVGDEDFQASMFEGNTHESGSRMTHHRFSSDCATVTESGDDYPKTIVIDYGEGCENRKGDVVSGRILVSITKEMHEAGAEFVMTYEDFSIGDAKVDMVKTKTNLGNEDGNWVLQSSQEKTITYEDGSTSTRNSTESTEWIAGFDTEEKEDNMFYRSGSGLVITSEGDEYSREITTALFFDGSCDYIKSGVIELNKAGEVTVIDFGDGECDEWATVTKDGESEQVDLSKKGRKGKRRGFKK